MQTCQRNSISSNLHSNSVKVRPDDGADDEDRDLEGTEDQTEVPDFQTFADGLSGEERSLNCKKISQMDY